MTIPQDSKPLSAPVLMWRFLRPYRWAVAGALVAVGFTTFSVLAFGWGLRELVDEGFAGQSGHYLNHALLMMLGLVLVLAFASYGRFFLSAWVAERVSADLRKAIYRHLVGLDPAFFETHKTGDQVSRINMDTAVLQTVLTNNLMMALRNVMTVAGGMAMLFVVSPLMTGMVLAVVPFVLVPIILVGRKVRVRARDAQGRIGDIGAFGHETLMGLQTIQSFVYENVAAARFDRIADAAFTGAMKHVRLRALLTALVISTVFTAVGVVLWMGGHQVLDGEITAGDLSAFVFYAIATASAAGGLSETASAVHQAMGAADRIAVLLAHQPALKGTGAANVLPPNIKGAVAFERISFSYPTRPGQKALDDVSLSIAAGQHVALVGPSGAGKTTVFQLLQRFFDAQGGVIKIDGIDISACNPADVRRHIGVVAQDPAIFSASVAENIRLGRPDASDDEVRQAAILAQAHDFIMALPEGYKTKVGERGSRLSGGQRQRIALARVALKNPPILLLDEATSALDSANEQAVMLALRGLMAGRTTIVIAHRLSTVHAADRIFVLDKGRLVAEGAHDDLYGRDTLYTHLAELQMRQSI